MILTHHSLIAHTAYADLLRALLDDAASDLRGSVERKTVGAKTYLYDRYRLGDSVRSRYIGEATPEREARLAEAAGLAETRRDRQANRARLARLLRSEGFATLDARTGALLTALARIGVFRLGGTLVGTIAFRLYEGVLGLRIGTDQLAQTGDIDVASFERLSLAIDDHVTEPVSAALAELDFAGLPGLDARHVWRWENAARDTQIEFLTPAFGPEDLRELPALGVSAQALNHLNYLLRAPIPAVALYRAGVLVQVPAPERFAIHKLIVSERRRGGTDALKSRKDRAQATLLIHALAETRPDDLALALEEALGEGPKWRARITAALARLPEARDALARALGAAERPDLMP